MPAPRIVALGGHEFRRAPDALATVEHLLALSRGERPRVCLLPTASGDPKIGIQSFYAALESFDCAPSHVSLFRLEHERVDLRAHLLAQDLLYVAGGSMLNLVAIWRAHGLPAIMREAWQRGVLIAGQSAGAMCWFERGITASGGRPQPAAGLGLLPGSLCVHYARDPARRAAYRAAVARGMPGGIALDDGAGMLFEGARPVEAFAARRGARVIRVEPDGGRARELELHALPLRPRAPAADDPALAEMRELRRQRARGRATIAAWRCP